MAKIETGRYILVCGGDVLTKNGGWRTVRTFRSAESAAKHWEKYICYEGDGTPCEIVPVAPKRKTRKRGPTPLDQNYISSLLGSRMEPGPPIRFGGLGIVAKRKASKKT